MDWQEGDKFKIINSNPKGIPIGTLLEYTGEKEDMCGTPRYFMKTEDGETIKVFEHWIKKV